MTADPLQLPEDDPHYLDEDPRAGARAVGCILVALAVEVALVAAVIVAVFR